MHIQLSSLIRLPRITAVKGRMIVALAALGLVASAAMLACRPSAERGSGGVTRSFELQAEPEPPQAAFRTLSEDYATTGVVLHLRWPAGAPLPEEPPTLAFCLPPDLTVKARWLVAAYDDRPVTMTASNGSPASPAGAAKNRSGAWLPETAGQVQFAGWMRRWPLYRLKLDQNTFEPVRKLQGKPAGEGSQSESEKNYDLTLALTWLRPCEPTTATAANVKAKGEESWRRVAKNLVANPVGLERFAQAEPPLPGDLTVRSTLPSKLAPGQRPWARLRIERDGLYRLGADDLIKAGFPASQTSEKDIRIFSQGRPVDVLRSEGGADLARGVYFLAEAGKGPYSRERVYWITVGADLPDALLSGSAAQDAGKADGDRLAEVTRVETLDRDNVLKVRHGDFLAIEELRWVDSPLTPGEDLNLPIELPHLADRGKPLKAELVFFADGDAPLGQMRIDASCGGKPPVTFRFSNPKDLRRQIELPAPADGQSATTLTLRVALDQPKRDSEAEDRGTLWFDRLTVTYTAQTRLEKGRLIVSNDQPSTRTLWVPLADLSENPGLKVMALATRPDGEAVRQLAVTASATGEKGFAWKCGPGEKLDVYAESIVENIPSLEAARLEDLTDPALTADLLVITHRKFREAAQKLADFHERQGWRVRVVDVQSVFDNFSDGASSPVALRALFAYALRHWEDGGPAHAMLVGDCDSDYLDVARKGVVNWVPTYTYEHGTDHWASDYWMATVAGSDNLGDIMLGRLSVARPEDAESIADKVVAYTESSRPGPWRDRLTFVSDNGEFSEVVDSLRRENTPPEYIAQRIFLDELPEEDNWYLPANYVERKQMKVSRTATTRILDAFRAGTAYMTFFGHGSPNIWTDERIWFGGDSVNSDNLRLENTGYYTFIANMTCNSGAIDYPTPPWNICITEDMMRVRKGGAVGCFVPSGPGVTMVHRQMGEKLHNAMFDDGLRALGEITQAAKARYALAGSSEDLLYMYLLLGDPVLDLNLTARRGVIPLPVKALRPGDKLDIKLKGIEPKTGRWIGALVDEKKEDVLWATPSEQTLEDGRIRLKLNVPESAPAGPAILRVYAWDPAGGRDMALATRIQIERPRLELAFAAPEGKMPEMASVKLSNRSQVDGSGQLALAVWDGATTRSLGQPAVMIGAGQSLTVARPLGASQGAPAVAEARLTADTAPDAADLPQTETVRELVSLPQGWTGWLKPLCQVENGQSGPMEVKLVAGVDPAQGRWLAELTRPDGQLITTQTLTVKAFGSGSRAEGVLRLDRSQLQPLDGTTAWLSVETSGTLTPPRRVASVALGSLEMDFSRVRIVPGSVRVRPQRLVEGETVFVDFEAENGGTAGSKPFNAGLMDAPSARNGRTLPNQNSNMRTSLGPLGAGRRLPVTLRWDPVGNAGEQNIWIQLQGAGILPDQPTSDSLVRVAVKALRKASVSIKRTWAETTEMDLQLNRMTLKAEVANSGEDDAHAVVVCFYRSELIADENKLGEVELEKVPGGGSATASFVWEFDPRRDWVPGTELPRPTVQAWLKGSSQRILYRHDAASPASSR